jgi:predicted phosphodiesterase
MRLAVLSDVHANWQAWNAVREDVRAQGVDAVVCLGDIVGYGPKPVETLRDVRENCDYFVLGNHDAAAADLLDPSVFSADAHRIIEWTRGLLDRGAQDWFWSLPLQLDSESAVFVHAETPAPAAFGYVEDPQDARACFAACTSDFIFVGHTHVPGVFRLDGDGGIQQRPAKDFVAPAGVRCLVNVGSVGDPRDGRRLASYAIFDEDARSVTFRSVDFDCAALRRDLQSTGLGFTPWFLRKKQAVAAPAGVGDMAAAKVATLKVDSKVSRARITVKRSSLASPRPAAPPKPPRGSGRRVAAVVASVIASALLLGGAVAYWWFLPRAEVPLAGGPVPEGSESAVVQGAHKSVGPAFNRHAGLVLSGYSDVHRKSRIGLAIMPQAALDDWARPRWPKGSYLQWEGLLYGGGGGEYTLEVEADAAAEVKIDGTKVLEGTAAWKQIVLVTNKFHSLQINQRQTGDLSRIRLWWTGPSTPREPVPAGRLWHWISQNSLATWTFDKESEGWTEGAGVRGLKWRAGYLEGTATARDSYLQKQIGPSSRLNLDGYGCVLLNLKNGTPATRASLSFQTDKHPMDAQARVAFTLQTNDAKHTVYYVNMATNSAWRGRLEALRLDLPVPGTGGVFSLDAIRIVESQSVAEK